MNVDLESKMALLSSNKDTMKAFTVLKELEQLSESTNVLYSYIDSFVDLIKRKENVFQVRGVRLLCKQAKWDDNRLIDSHLDDVFTILESSKPTTVRQTLACLKEVAIYKKQLRQKIEIRIEKIDCLKFKDTMQNLIAKDIAEILKITHEIS